MAHADGETGMTDEALYRRLVAGDEGALEELVGRYHSPLLGFVYRQTGDRQLAEDLMQEIFTRLVTYEGPPPEHFRAWAFTIARNLVRDYQRSAYYRREQAGRREEHPWPEPVADPVATLDEQLQRADERRRVIDALQQLNPDQREVLVLRFYHDLKLEEIAAATNTPLGTVKSRIFHALKRMQAYLGRQREHTDHEETDEEPNHPEYRRRSLGRAAS